MILILGSPGGGTSYFTKFLRLNGFYAGKSLEDGRDQEDHIGWLYRRKWHESLVYAKEFCTPILKQLGVGQREYEMLFNQNFLSVKKMIEKVLTEETLNHFIEDNANSLKKLYDDEFPDKTIPHGFKNPRNFLVLPFLKAAYPDAKVLTVERLINPNPSKQGPEGRGFARNAAKEAYRDFVFGHDDDFRFQFEDFMDVNKVNELLEFVGLDTLTQEQLEEQHKELEFDVKKINK
jgi:hypothetical protein